MRQYGRVRGEVRMAWGQRASLSVAGSVLLMGCALSSFAAVPDDDQPKSLSVPDVVAEVLPSVVSVMAHGPIRLAPSQTLPSGSRSGLIISPGFIPSSNHLVTGAMRLVVGLYDGRLVPGRVVGRDFLTDLALIKIEIEGLVPAKLGKSSRLRIGETVVAIGNPLAMKGGATVSVGVVSAVDRAIVPPSGETLYNLIQSDAAINPGSSGGPLVDLSGRVVVINTTVAPAAQNISYAVAIDEAIPVVQSLLVRGSMLRPSLGFVPVTITDSVVASFSLDVERGVLIVWVEPGSPAAQAGLREGDVVTAVDITQVYNMSDLWHALLKDGSPSLAVTLSVVRKSTQEKIPLKRPVTK